MQLTPEDIQKQQFHIRFRGFDVEEVDNFLEKVGENFLLLNKEKQELEEKVDQLKQQLFEFREREKTFQNAILSTQKVADEIEEKSRQEAEKRRRETEQEIEGMKNEAHAEVATLEKQVDELRETKGRIKEELRQFLQSYMSLLEEGKIGESERPTLRSEAVSQPREKKEEEVETTTAEDIYVKEKEGNSEDEDSILYEKIELPGDIDFSELGSGEEETEQEDNDLFGDIPEDWADDKESAQEHPALDGKMLFNLDDPVDYESEPAVVIDSDESDQADESEVVDKEK